MVDPPASPKPGNPNLDPSARSRSTESNDSLVPNVQTDSEKFLGRSTEGLVGGDPEGTYESEDESSSGSDYSSGSESDSVEGDSSTHAESIQPTRSDSYENAEAETNGQRIWDSKMSVDSATTDEPFYDESTGYSSSRRPYRPSVQAHSQSTDIQSSLASNMGVFRKMGMSTSIRQMQPLPDEEDGIMKTEEPRHATFPSNRLLVLLLLCIVLSFGTLVGVLTYYLWNKDSLAPEVPPGSSEADFDIKSGVENVPTDKELLTLFVEISGDALAKKAQPAAKAAGWMLYDDPGKMNQDLLPRSPEGWQQRYILALTYFSTTTGFGTNKTDTKWLSCNPRTDGIDDCLFAYPTELPNGQVIYDPVPSYRWLSDSDECLWGGVGCVAKVYSEEDAAAGAIVGSAVSSIMLADQNLNGGIVTELLSLPELTVLDLSYNGLSGSVSEGFGNFTSVKLSNNAITGKIPASLVGEESPLEVLDLGSNKISGTIPTGISLSTSLKSLSLGNNELTGTIPILGNMPLEVFHAESNNLVGILPFDYGYMGEWPSTLREWWVSDNYLTGYLSEGLGFLTSLEDFRVSGNYFQGTIPESIGTMDRLFRFEVDDNRLTGTIPEAIASMSSLQDVSVQFNGLTGTVPTDLCFLDSMVSLEANCLFMESEAVVARENFVLDEKAREAEARAQARQDAITKADSISMGSNTDVIPVFSTLEEAVAAARADGYVATAGPKDPDAPSPPQGPFEYTEIDCLCCTTCCNPDTAECLTFSSNKLTIESPTSYYSSSGMVTNPTKDIKTMEVNSMLV
eukprot:CAMPEP_0116088166 /NCGR_PEP_ID=MMETSP0327-20121206/5731_1 /TAXON_ID=44447 /ORGANISM="Pseudo-nitzschia delicatissima, Strain B596" /LENGTH=795 /DNA_ID=CAMNT_0003579241 /DNA_START=30 /DNA_END=2418 /DNA_ORIENTATION=+